MKHLLVGAPSTLNGWETLQQVITFDVKPAVRIGKSV